jgi:type II secretory pathway pseudopilin PulG
MIRDKPSVISHSKKGFTIIELMLAMSFVAVLLIAIVMTTLQISHIYTRGLTLKEVNQVGRTTTEDLQRVITSSMPFDVNPDATSLTSKYRVKPGGGRLCTGRYSYAWNYGSALAGGPSAPAIYNKYDDNTEVRFVKVEDSSTSLCINASSPIPKLNSTELLTAGDRDLVLHSFSVTNVANDTETGQALYAISMTIGTNDQDQLVTNDTSCRPPGDGIGYEDYCAVNQFDIVVRAGNKSGGE